MMDEFKAELILAVEDAESLLAEARREKSKWERLERLVFNGVLDSVRQMSHEPWTTILRMAKERLNKTEDGKKEEYKSALRMLEKRLSNMCGKKAKVKEIWQGGMPECYIEAKFTLEGSKREFLFCVPIPENITEQTLDFAHRGKVALGERKENASEYFFSTYNTSEEVLDGAFKKYLEETR